MKVNDIIERTKYLQFVVVAVKPKTVVVGIFNNSSGDEIGVLSWYGPWRQYTFDPGYGTTWNPQCLRDVTGVLGLLNDKHKTPQ